MRLTLLALAGWACIGLLALGLVGMLVALTGLAIDWVRGEWTS